MNSSKLAQTPIRNSIFETCLNAQEFTNFFFQYSDIDLFS